MSNVREYLVMMAKMSSHNQKPDGFVYNSYEEFVLKNGTDFGQGTELSPEYEAGEMKQCFMNAYHLMQSNSNLIYCEGWAENIIPVHHAWCMDADTHEVVDPTWGDSNKAFYYGVPFKSQYVYKTAASTGVYGIFYNYKDNHPLIRDTTTRWKWNG